MSRYVPTPQGLVHEVEFGGSGPAIVLIHGLGGSTTNWNAVGPSLGDLGVVKAIDLPGFGLTRLGPTIGSTLTAIPSSATWRPWKVVPL